MLVRCDGCGAAVSPWAARCPECGAGLESARALPERDEARATERANRRGRAVAAGAALVVIVAAGAVWLVWRAGHTGHTGSPGHAQRAERRASPLPAGRRLPADLASHRLFYADEGAARLLSVDGRVLRDFGSDAASGSPQRGVHSGRSIVFVHAGTAYAITEPFESVPIALGAATRVFPAGEGAVALDRGRFPQRSSVQLFDPATGAPTGGPVMLPAGTEALAYLDGRLLLGNGDGGPLLVWSPSSRSVTTTIGPARYLIDTRGSLVAWTADHGCDIGGGCPLHLTDASTGVDRVLPAPAGVGGFAGGGAFSPDGRHLAVFAATARPDSPLAQPAVIDLETGGLERLEPSVPFGEPVASAAWTADGAWLLFCGLDGPLYADRPEGGTPAIALPAPASFTFVAL